MHAHMDDTAGGGDLESVSLPAVGTLDGESNAVGGEKIFVTVDAPRNGGLPGGSAAGMLTLVSGDQARGGGNATAPITATALNQSQAVLAAPQVAALQQLQQQQQNQQQLAKIVAETLGAQNASANANSTKSGGTPPPTKEKRPGS